MVGHPAATVRLLHGWLSDLEQWRNKRTRESTRRQLFAAGAPNFLWAIKPLHSLLYSQLREHVTYIHTAVSPL